MAPLPGRSMPSRDIPSTHHKLSPSHYIIRHSPLVFLSPTSKMIFEKIRLFFAPLPFVFFACFLCARVLDCLFYRNESSKNIEPHLRRLDKIENTVRSFMSLQFEHNNFFRNELKEQKFFMEYMNKELDDMSKEFYGLRS